MEEHLIEARLPTARLPLLLGMSLLVGGALFLTLRGLENLPLLVFLLLLLLFFLRGVAKAHRKQAEALHEDLREALEVAFHGPVVRRGEAYFLQEGGNTLKVVRASAEWVKASSE